MKNLYGVADNLPYEFTKESCVLEKSSGIVLKVYGRMLRNRMRIGEKFREILQRIID